MQTKDAHKIIMITVLLLGGILRFFPVVLAGFPINDGGMFYVMVEELVANQFLLPAFTQYNLAEIPYAYPPFGFYITGIISSLFKIPALDVIRWLPPFVSTLSLLGFYFMANELLGSRIQAALATLFYGFLPDAYGWAIMGGGITRSFGLLFLYLTIGFANRLFTRSSGLLAGLTALFAALTILSHPETGPQAAGVCILLWIFRGRSKKAFVLSMGVVLGTIVLTAPWWGSVLADHGLAPFQSALHTNDDGTFHLAKLLLLQHGGGVFFNLTLAIGLIGFLAVLARREFILPIWLGLPYFLDPRSAGGMVLIPISLLAAYGFDKVLGPALLSIRQKKGEWLTDRFVLLTMLGMAFYQFFNASIFDMGLAGNSLSESDRQAISWADENIIPGSDFILLTGEQYSMNDPFQEWFPALTSHHSRTTLQGSEWTLSEEFFPRYGDLVSLQHCDNMACIDAWVERTGLGYQYIVLKILPKGSNSPLNSSLTFLLRSIRNSSRHELIYEGESAAIFKYLVEPQ